MSRDALVIGGGHDGLVAATFLARAGLKVALCEARDVLGGRCAREEFVAGHFAPGLLHETAGLRPAVIEALDLPRHGLRLLDEAPPLHALVESGPALLRHADDGAMVGQLRHLHEADAWAWRRWRDLAARLRPALSAVMDTDAPDPEPRGLSGVLELLRLGLGLRRLGARDLHELLRIAPMSLRDWMGETFRSESLATLLALPALGGTWLGPWSAGGALRLLLQETLAGRPVAGGPAGLTAALCAAAKAAGVELFTGAAVRRVRVEQGRVTGVDLVDGSALDAPVVAAAVEPRRALLELLPPRSLPSRVAERLQHWRTRGTTAVFRLALSGAPEWPRAGAAPVQRAVLAPDLTAIERAFEGVKYGRLPTRPVLDIAVPSLADGTLAPAGHQVLTALVSYVPRDLRGGWSGAARRALGESIWTELLRHAPGLRGLALGEELLTPPDLERRYGLSGGQIHHGEPALDQVLHLRPDPACARGVTPLPGFFLCGAGRHPGGDVNGMAGLLGARAVLAAARR